MKVRTMKKIRHIGLFFILLLLLTGCYSERIALLEQRIERLEQDNHTLKHENYSLQLEKRYNNYLEYGPTYVLEHINFTHKGSRILPSSYQELNNLAKNLRKNNDLLIRIICHTDDLGSPQFNYRLSVKRLHSIQNYLTSRGVRREQVIGIGQGEFWPIASNRTWDGKNENRRVEVQFAMR